MARLVERQKNDWFIPEWAISLLHLNLNSQMICFSAQAVGYSLIWHRARQKSGVHPSGEEGPGDELSQAHESPHLQQAKHGKNHSKMLFSFSTVSSSTLNDSLKSSKVSVGGRDFCGACTSRLLPGSNSKVFPCWLQPGAIFSCCSVTASRCLVLLHFYTDVN